MLEMRCMFCRYSLDLTPGTDVIELHCYKLPLAEREGQTVRPQEGGGAVELLTRAAAVQLDGRGRGLERLQQHN